MRNGKGIICIFSVLLILLGIVSAVFREESPASAGVPLVFELDSERGREVIRSWENDEGILYVFLPGYGELSDLYLCLDENADVRIDGKTVADGDSCEKYVLDTAYDLLMESGCKSLIFMKAGQLPALYIDVQSGSMDYIHLEKGNKESGVLRLYSEDGMLLGSGQLEEIKGRGNSSWGADKKPYNLTLANDMNLLNMGTARNWALLAEGYNHLNIRNKIVYDYAHALGMPYTPDCEWVDLYLNGTYAGVYLLSERNEIHSQRIDIPAEGSFLVSLEYEQRLKEQHYPYVITQAGQALRIRHGEDNTALLQQQWQSVENAILSENGMDPLTGLHWSDLIDLDSWARKYLIEELFGNMDAGSLSQFFYLDGRDPRGKICAGPVWDYDFAMGGESVWLRPYTDYFTMNRVYVNEEIYTPWFPALYQQEIFLSRVEELYAREFLPLMEQWIRDVIPAYAQRVLPSSRLDGIRWNWDREEICDEPEYIIRFLHDRTDFLTDLWVNGHTYHTVCVDAGRGGLYGYFAVKDGESLPPLPAAEELGGVGWYQSGTEQPFDMTRPIYEDTHIYVKKAESGLPAIHYVPAAAVILILPAVWLADRYRTGKNRRYRHDSAKVN